MEDVLFANLLSNIFPAFQQSVYKWKADKAFFNDNATGQPKEEGSNATLNPAPSSIFKWWVLEGFLVGVPLLRQLMLTALLFVI